MYKEGNKYAGETATGIKEASVIERQLDVLCDRIASLETAIDRIGFATSSARNCAPRLDRPSESCQPRDSMSPVAMRIASSNERIADLTAMLECLTSEIEL